MSSDAGKPSTVVRHRTSIPSSPGPSALLAPASGGSRQKFWIQTRRSITLGTSGSHAGASAAAMAASSA